MPESTSPNLSIRLKESDNVVIARAELLPGTAITGEDVTTAGPIPAGHKIATLPIAQGAPIRKYNQVIGFAGVDIAPGEHVHVHNVVLQDFQRATDSCAEARSTDYVTELERARFDGFLRPDGRAGTRNYLGILTSVNCSATAARYIAEHFDRRGAGRLSLCRRRGRPGPRHGLRYGRQRRWLCQPAAHALGHGPASQLRRCPDGRAGLRGQSDRVPAGSLRNRAGTALSDHDHPGERRHAAHRRARRSACCATCCPRRARHGAKACRRKI